MLFEYLDIPYSVLAAVTLALLFWRPIAGMLVLVAIFPMDPWSPRLPVPGINTETVLLSVATLVTVLRFGARIPPLRYSGPPIAYILLIGIGFALSIPWARGIRMVDGDTAVWGIFKQWKASTFSGLFFVPVYFWFSDARDRRALLEALSVGVFISSMFGLFDLVVGVTPGGQGGRAGGLQIDPNALALAVGSTIFVPLYLATRARDLPRWRRVFHGVTYGVAFIAVLLSLSRGNYIAFVVAHLVYLALVSRVLLLAGVVTVALFATIAFPLLPTSVRERIETTTASGSGYRVAGAERVEASTAYRLALTQVAFDMFKDSPIWGHGLLFYYFHVPQYGAKYGTLELKDSHSIVLSLAVELGAVGLAWLGWIVATVYLLGRRLWRSSSSEYYVGAVLLACSTHLLIGSLSTNSFNSTRDISAYFWILLALAARTYVERYAEAPAPAAVPVVRGNWRRFSQRIPAAASQQ
jgi:O-antigen ligase